MKENEASKSESVLACDGEGGCAVVGGGGGGCVVVVVIGCVVVVVGGSVVVVLGCVVDAAGGFGFKKDARTAGTRIRDSVFVNVWSGPQRSGVSSELSRQSETPSHFPSCGRTKIS